MPFESAAAPAHRAFGNYEILETIGQGGMGVVYRALDTTLDRIVALKVLKDDLRNQPILLSRFQREAQAVAALRNPHIVQIYSVGTVDRIPYIAMEYLEAVPLSTVLQQERTLEWTRVLEIAEPIADALACAHAAHVIHRDIKPANILMDPAGKAYVTDFGIAKILTADTQLTADGSLLGTPQFMAPERCQNGSITASSDLYSLGVMMFQMIAGRLPFEAPTPGELIKKILAAPPACLRDYCPDIPEDVERLIFWTLEKKPKHRPSSAAVLRDAILRVRNGKPLDEGAAHLSSALAAYRSALSRAPAVSRPNARPGTLGTPQSTAPSKPRVRRPRVSPLVQTLIMGALVIAVTAVAGHFSFKYLAQGAGAGINLDPIEPARWTNSRRLMEFIDEAPGTYLVRINLAEFECGPFYWDAARGRTVVQLDGVRNTLRFRQTALCSVEPARRHAVWILPPTTSLTESGPVRPFQLRGVMPQSFDGALLLQLTDGSVVACDETKSGLARVYPVDRNSSSNSVGPSAGSFQQAEASSPDGQFLLRKIREGQFDFALQLVTATAKEVVDNLGPAAGGVWHPAGQDIIAVARDLKGQWQLYAIRTVTPFGRTQLTFLSGGIIPNCVISSDGRWAISSRAMTTSPVLVFVDVSSLKSG
ncbi:MAG: serine/threonine-protein kinase [Candidatus Hydrogenedentes bacterium]|nr:serine/threonine-protein kinase [Candidatus Hydrogenedentota bacterium]